MSPGSQVLLSKKDKIFWYSGFSIIFVPGEMAEWSIAAVLKTVEGNTSGGSNPSLSATKQIPAKAGFFVYSPSVFTYSKKSMLITAGTTVIRS